MSNVAIESRELSKIYRIGVKEERKESLAASIFSTLKTPFRSFKKLKGLGTAHKDQNAEDVLWALRDITFDVNHGDVMGIIGRNGAGKSTLLKIFSRITEPSKGKVIIHGRVASLLEVGTGFHPDLTGRENVFLNGSILGMKNREIVSKFDEIVAFSGVEKFIDTPVKRYSSGMKVRLAFSVAAHLDPEILMVDEVLAVGDAAFQKMCLAKMDDVAKGGRTVLFVSHQLGMIRALCNKGILLKNGEIEFKGDITETLEMYEKSIESKFGNMTLIEFQPKNYAAVQYLSAEIMDEYGESKKEFDVFERVVLKIKYKVNEPSSGVAIGIVVERNGEPLFYSIDTDKNPERYDERAPGIYTTTVVLPTPLKAGRFIINLELVKVNIQLLHRETDALCFDVVEKSFNPGLMSYSTKFTGSIVTQLNWSIVNYEPILENTFSLL